MKLLPSIQERPFISAAMVLPTGPPASRTHLPMHVRGGKFDISRPEFLHY